MCEEVAWATVDNNVIVCCCVVATMLQDVVAETATTLGTAACDSQVEQLLNNRDSDSIDCNKLVLQPAFGACTVGFCKALNCNSIAAAYLVNAACGRYAGSDAVAVCGCKHDCACSSSWPKIFTSLSPSCLVLHTHPSRCTFAQQVNACSFEMHWLADTPSKVADIAAVHDFRP